MEFAKLLQERRSVRKYDGSKKVTEEQVKELIEAASMAPSWRNSETWRYYAVISEEELEAFRAAALPEFNQNSSKGSALVVSTFVKNISGFGDQAPANECGNEWGAYDLGLSNAYFCLKASDMGMDTLIMGMRDSDYIRNKLGIPENEEIMAVIALGYREGDVNCNPRKAVDEVLKCF